MTSISNEHRILVADDEESMREFLTIMLRREGYLVDTASDGAQAVGRLRDTTYNLVISDIKMPRLDGFGLLSHVKERSPETAVIMMTAFSSTGEAVEAMKQGAYDYITKPFRNEEIRLIIRNALERQTLRQENQRLRSELDGRYAFSGLIGKSKAMREVFDLLKKVATSDAGILIAGESGTGKELVARAIHHNSDRKENPFVPINCGAIPENLLESELFGHEKGSFTGAINQKPGLFEIAAGGTLFLDEIGELPMLMQVKLLRVIQEKEFRRVGGTKDLRADVRLVAASNRDLDAEVAAGRFRQDLFYRLNIIRVDIPPLRERREDISLLVDHFCDKLSGKGGIAVTDDVMRRLLDYDWPGNVRELENAIERCVVLGQGGEITVDCLPPALRGSTSGRGAVVDLPETGFDLDAHLGGIERDLLLKALEKGGGIRKRAAEILGITFRSIRYRLAKFGIDAGDEGE